MAGFSKWSLNRKVMVLSASLAGVAIAGIFLFSRQSYSLAKNEFLQRATILSELLANQSAYDLMMQDAQSLDSQLTPLVAEGKILAAAYFNLDFQPVAGINEELLQEFAHQPGDAHWWTTLDSREESLVIRKTVINPEQGQPVGYVVVAVPTRTLSAYHRKAATFFVLGLGSIILLLFASHRYMRKVILDPIQHMSRVVEEFGQGNLDVSVEVTAQDEIGKLAENINFMINSRKRAMDEIRRRTQQAEEAQRRAEEMRQEAIKQRKYLEKQFERIAEILTAVQRGDFTQRLEIEQKDAVGDLMEKINSMIADLGTLISESYYASQSVSEASHKISSSADSLSHLANVQEDQTKEVATAMEEMSKTILESSKNASQALEMARQAAQVASEGEQSFRQMIDGMHKIANVVRAAADRVITLGKSSSQIGEIVEVISDIADQTNLLALNAAIEAARGGEQGRGFAVVAEEVRKLAERSATATGEIERMISSIQQETEAVVLSMQEGNQEVEENTRQADSASQCLSRITTSVKSIVDVIDHIAIAAQEQSAVSEQIAKNVETISQSASKVSSASRELADTAENLDRLTRHLQELIARFQVQEKRVPDGANVISLN